MTAKLLLDEMYSPVMAEELRGRGHDVTAVAADPELVSLEDAMVLRYATSHQRCVVTENVRDFVMLARCTSHAGLLLVNSQRWPRTRAGMGRLIAALDKLIAADQVPGPDGSAWLN